MVGSSEGWHLSARSRLLTSDLIGALVILSALAVATRRAWLSDDAFISLRYAANLAAGEGLVFNEGERVEGYTNLLWTLIMALAMVLGLDAERLAVLGGLASFAASLVLLYLAHRRQVAKTHLSLPLGLVLVASSGACLDFATSGLETSFFSFLQLAGVIAIGACRPGLAGLVLALAALTRPDGVLLLGLAGLALLLRDRPAALRFGLVAGGILGPAALARFAYYGSLVPNTWHAKSGDLVWWSQGLSWLELHLYAHPWLLLLPLALRAAPLPTIAALASTVYLTRVGGDFMVGRLLVPATVLGAYALGQTIGHWELRDHRWRLASMTAALLAIVARPPLSQGESVAGIVDERAYYSAEMEQRLEADIETLRPLTQGVPLTIALGGAQARMAYRLSWPVVIESESGLTDATIARQRLLKRGRIGHEKKPTLRYLVLDRKVDLTFAMGLVEHLQLDDRLPPVYGDFGGLAGRLLRWSFPIADALKERGVKLNNYPAMLDADIASLAEADPAEACRLWRSHWWFYFAHAEDPEREEPFRQRCPDLDPAAEEPYAGPSPR